MLASRSQVAHALGLDDESALSDGQANRVDGLIERVSRLVERESQRSFEPGPMSALMVVTDGRIYLDQVDSVGPVTTMSGGEVDTELAGNWLSVTIDGRPIPSGVRLTVDYTRGAVPAGVSALVAGVVARLLTIEPGSPESMATSITAGADYSWRAADWVSSTALLTADELVEARSYRNPLPSTIIHRL